MLDPGQQAGAQHGNATTVDAGEHEVAAAVKVQKVWRGRQARLNAKPLQMARSIQARAFKSRFTHLLRAKTTKARWDANWMPISDSAERHNPLLTPAKLYERPDEDSAHQDGSAPHAADGTPGSPVVCSPVGPTTTRKATRTQRMFGFRHFESWSSPWGRQRAGFKDDDAAPYVEWGW